MARGKIGIGSGWTGDNPAHVDAPDGNAPTAGSSGAGTPGPRGSAEAARAFREALALVDGEGLSDRERVDLIAELERVKGAAAAAQARLTHTLRLSREEAAPRDAARSVGSEVALARRCPPSAGDRLVGMARALVTEMPATHAALTAGVCSERHAQVVVQASAVLTVEDRAVLDARVGPLLGRLTPRQAEHAARRVTLRPAPDGMAYLTVLGPLVEVVGAHAALQARAKAVVGGQCPDQPPQGRGVGAVAADTALALLSGRVDPATVQPVEVHLVMTDRALLGTGHPDRSVTEPARIPGHGPLPAPLARAHLRAEQASVWLRRLYTSPDGRDLVAMDSHRRLFTGLLRRMLILRDDTCPTPWCAAPIAHADHVHPARDGGPTSYTNGNGDCARCNHVKEAPGWTVTVHDRTPDTRPGAPPPAPPDAEPGRRQILIHTPAGATYTAQPPPLLGWGSDPDPPGPRP